MSVDETGVRSDDIRIGWSVVAAGGLWRGEVRLDPVDWGMASTADRLSLARDAVGQAVLNALNVDWNLLNARFDDPNY